MLSILGLLVVIIVILSAKLSLSSIHGFRAQIFSLSIIAIFIVQPTFAFAEAEIVQFHHHNLPEPLLLPDLKTLPPKDLRLVINPDTGTRSLRFSNHILNRGPGVLEMMGQFNSETGTVHVTQIVFGKHFFRTEKDTGVFYYHVVHSHWHWEGFSEYKIWSVTSSGGLEKVLASSDKVGYCLEDVELFRGNHSVLELTDGQTSPEEPQFSSCYWRRQGLSIGWVDIYRSHIPGQSIDITHLPNGIYALQSSVDPDNLIWEGNNSNNTAIIYFSLNNDQINILNRPLSPIKPGYLFK